MDWPRAAFFVWSVGLKITMSKLLRVLAMNAKTQSMPFDPEALGRKYQ
jgi:hypothetical protein